METFFLFLIPSDNQLTNYKVIIIENQLYIKTKAELLDNKIMFLINKFD